MYVPALLVLGIAELPKVKRFRIEKELCIMALSYLALLILIFFVGETSLANPNRVFLKLFVGFGLALYAASQFQIKEHVIFLSAYILGVGVDQSILVSYSYWIDFDRYGYGLLLDPYSGKEVNSPGASNLLAMCFGYFFPLAMAKRYRKVTFVFCIILLGIICMLAFQLKARSFVVVLLMTLFITPFLFFRLWGGLKRYALMCASSGSLLLGYFLGSPGGEQFLARFSSLHSNTRIKLLLEGVPDLFKHPLGGFLPPKDIYDGIWFHNLFLDIGRIAGWVGVLGLFSSLFLLGYFVYRKRIWRQREFPLYIWTSFICFTLMMQDVVIEGSFQLLLAFFIASVFMLASKDVSRIEKI